MLREAGEHLHPLTNHYRSDTAVADRLSGGGHLDLLAYAFGASRAWLSHAWAVRRLLAREKFDVVVGDETYDLLVAQIFHLLTIPAPFVMMYDFLGLEAMTNRRTERLGVYFWNLAWALDRRVLTTPKNRAVFIGQAEDVPDSRFGPLLPNRREHAHRCYEFVGYVLPFDPPALRDSKRLHAELGYGSPPLVVCSVGGLAVGRDLLELCGQAYALLTQTIPDLQMVLICGPGIEPDSLEVPEGVDVRGYVPRLYEHLAASELAVVQAGGTTTLELTALNRPFVYFPVEGQCDQEIVVAGRLARHRAGIRMSRATATPADLAQTISESLDADVSYASIPLDGADRIANLVLERATQPPVDGPASNSGT